MTLLRLETSGLAPDPETALATLLTSPPGADDLIKDEPQTRVWHAALPSGAAVVVKTYRRRSLLDFTRESLTRYRAQREFDALRFLVAAGVPCSRPVCWACGDDAADGRFESLVTFEEPDTVGLKAWLRSGAADDRWIEPVAALVRQGHEAGFYHGALAPRNILLRPANGAGAACLFIDTPKSIVFPRSIVGTRMARHDLMTMLGEVCRVAGDASLAPFLSSYGEPDAAIPALVERIRRYRPNRNTRSRMRAEFLIRRRFG